MVFFRIILIFLLFLSLNIMNLNVLLSRGVVREHDTCFEIKQQRKVRNQICQTPLSWIKQNSEKSFDTFACFCPLRLVVLLAIYSTKTLHTTFTLSKHMSTTTPVSINMNEYHYIHTITYTLTSNTYNQQLHMEDKLTRTHSHITTHSEYADVSI